MSLSSLTFSMTMYFPGMGSLFVKRGALAEAAPRTEEGGMQACLSGNEILKD